MEVLWRGFGSSFYSAINLMDWFGNNSATNLMDWFGNNYSILFINQYQYQYPLS
jgi:hypothetical protein